MRVLHCNGRANVVIVLWSFEARVEKFVESTSSTTRTPHSTVPRRPAIALR